MLNAADPLVVEAAAQHSAKVIYFALDPNHPVMAATSRRQRKTVFIRNGTIVRAEGTNETEFMPLANVPLTHGGRIGFQVENTLAALAAAWSLGLPDDLVRAGAESFRPTLDQNAGRFNTLELRGLTVIIDYGHNPSALRKLIEALDNFPQQHRISVYSAPGDRRNEDIVEQGRMLGAAFDAVWLYEGDYCRGREPGDIMDLLSLGLENATTPPISYPTCHRCP